jgi:integrase
MARNIKVYVTRVGNRPTFQLQWNDPITQRQKRRTTDIPASDLSRDRKAADRLAAELAVQLNSGSAAIPSKFRWDDFRDQYESLVVPGLARQTGVKIRVVLDHVERILSPIRLQDVTEGRLTHLVAELRKQGVAETTIKGYLAHLKAALNWAVGQKLLLERAEFPKVHRSKRSNGTPMKGRPPKSEEFERMISAVPKVVGEARAADWVHYLWGVWFSGLRLEESLNLWWDRPEKIYPEFPKDGHPILRIPGELEKGNTDRLHPMAPEFALFLQKTPESLRTGPVFRLNGRQGRYGPHQVSKIVSKIGEAARVKVFTDPKDPTNVKYASTHDLRRAFGVRWAARISPTELMVLMRHRSIQTTLRYYVGADAQRTADIAWAAFEQSQRAFLAASSDKSSDTTPSGGANAAPLEEQPAQEITEPNRSRPGVIRTHDQGIMSPLL